MYLYTKENTAQMHYSVSLLTLVSASLTSEIRIPPLSYNLLVLGI
jgi:hypothetical protein